MDVKGDPSAPQAGMEHGFASPNPEETDTAAYYSTQSRDREMDADQAPQQPQGSQDETSPDRNHSRASVSVDELQLAAQLTQGLAPMMAAHDQAQEQHLRQAQEADMQPRERSYDDHAQHDSFQDQPRVHEQQAQDAEPEYQDHIRGPEYQDQVHSDAARLHQELQSQLQDDVRELQDILRQQAQAQTPGQSHYAAPSPGAPHLHQHVPLNHLGQQYQLQDSSVPPRKRSKVSRACDECRRKKIKCDAMSEGGEEPCSNCRRSSSRCLFSRIPQKRGPSKG